MTEDWSPQKLADADTIRAKLAVLERLTGKRADLMELVKEAPGYPDNLRSSGIFYVLNKAIARALGLKPVVRQEEDD